MKASRTRTSPFFFNYLVAAACTSLAFISSSFAAPDLSSYTRPLLFAPEDNNIFLTSPQLKWQIEGSKINFGGLAFDSESIRFLAAPGAQEGETHVAFGWPTILTKDGSIEIRVDGKPVWQTEVASSDLTDWKNRLKGSGELKALAGTNFGVTSLTIDEIEAFRKKPMAQMCFVSKKSESEILEVCSSPSKVVMDNKSRFRLVPVQAATGSTVNVNGEIFGARGIANFPGTKPIQFTATFPNNSSLEFSISIPRLKMLDVVWKSDQKGKELIVFTGQGAKPVGEVKDLIVPPNHFWSATGLDEEIIWQTTISKETPLLRVHSSFSIPLTYIVQFTDLPDESDRIYISSRTGAGTYSGRPNIFGRFPPQAKIRSREKSVKRKSAKEFVWKFHAPKKGERNRSRISLLKKEKGKEKEWVAHYQLYRGYPFQAAARLTGLGTAELKTAFVGEASLTWFAEDLLLDSYLLDHHRWGFSGRYFRALTDLEIKDKDGETVTVKPFETINLDGRYNLIPGLWNRDELFGPIISLNSVKIVNYKANFVGVGAFWARTMPKFFDDIFNIIPLFRYPKYLDVEFIYYPVSLTNSITPGKSYFLNFSGRIFWTKRFFGEGGFGLKQFDFRTAEEGADPINLLVGYGTGGFGLTF